MDSRYCWRCGETYTDDETANPLHDEHGDPVCDECHDDIFRFCCALCENMDDKASDADGEFFDGSHFFVLREDADDDHGAGIYGVLRRPFYMGPLIGSGSFLTGHVVRLRGLPEGLHDGPSGYICNECQLRHLHIGPRSVCLNISTDAPQ